METPKTLPEAVRYFRDPDVCLEFLAFIRWPDGVVKCPLCGSDKVHFLANQRRWKCSQKHERRQFSAKVGTIFEDSPLGLDKWLPAVWQVVNCKNGISSYETARVLGVTQKTAWFMNHRIRLAMQAGSFEKMTGEVEADETFIGGLARFMHKDKNSHLRWTQSLRQRSGISKGQMLPRVRANDASSSALLQTVGSGAAHALHDVGPLDVEHLALTV